MYKKELNKIEKFAEKVWHYELNKKEIKEENIFLITDYVIERDKKNLWIEYQKLKNIFAVEEIHGTLFWVMKNILLISKTKSMHETGLKMFVYSKTKKAIQKFSQDELDEKFWNLTKSLNDSRRGGADLDILLEKWILDL